MILILVPLYTDVFNSCITNGIFSDKLELADITPIFESVDCMSKENYRPVNTLNSISKIFEKLIQQHLVPFFDQKLSIVYADTEKGITHKMLS